MKIVLFTAAELTARGPELAGLLREAVEHGASLGFTLPLTETEVREYWRKVAAELGTGGRLLLAALDENGRVIGSGQLALESRANGRHRAEVQKLMVRTAHRGRGTGAALMRRIEAEAAGRGRRLLFLDTSLGASGAQRFYENLGYTFAGSIPDYAADPDGRLVPNAIFYKQLS